MGEKAGLGWTSFEKALMGCLRRRGVTLRGGFLRADGLDDEDMAQWGAELEARLLAFETRFRGAQHLLSLNNREKEPQGFRWDLRHASADIFLMLMKRRDRLSALDRFSKLYTSVFSDASGALAAGTESFLVANIRRLLESLRGGFPEGADGMVVWSPVSQVLEMTFTRGRAQRSTKLAFGRELTGTLLERAAATVALWRDIEQGMRQEIAKPECWPSESAQQAAEEARALFLIEAWMRGLSESDRATIRAHGPKALSRWSLGVRA